MKIEKDRNIVNKYELPFGPDIVYDGNDETEIPNPDLPLELHGEYFQRTKNVYSKRVIIARILLPIVICIITYYFIFHGSNVDKHNIDEFDVDSVADYALASAGAEIISTLAASPPNVVLNWSNGKSINIRLPFTYVGPETILHPSVGPGDCWAFAGNDAVVRIRLSHLIIMYAVSVEHIPKQISPTGNISSAPRHFSIYGVDGASYNFRLDLGTYEYLDNNKPIQTFFLTRTNYPLKEIEIHFLSNHGHPDYTCVYKIRVHGESFPKPKKYKH